MLDSEDHPQARRHEWPQDCLELAGRFADFPLREDSAAPLPADVSLPGLQWLNWHNTA